MLCFYSYGFIEYPVDIIVLFNSVYKSGYFDLVPGSYEPTIVYYYNLGLVGMIY
jgi:hypothetical protein